MSTCRAVIYVQGYYTGVRGSGSRKRREHCSRRPKDNGWCWQHQELAKAQLEMEARMTARSGKDAPKP